MDAPARPFAVFESKLRIPDLREGVVSRTGLVNRLRADRSSRLATVVAAPGYGKTTVLAQWAARDERPFVWLRVDERDNDPLVLLRHLAAGLDRVEPLEPPLLAALAAPDTAVWADAAPRLAAALAACLHPFVVVLDDADRLLPGDAADVLLVLAEHVPAGSMLVLAGRGAPPLPIARLRAGGELLELGSRELALNRREAELLLRRAGTEPDAEALADLVAKAEGWAAGLYLASRALGEADPSSGSGGFDGTDTFISDYFGAEHLSHLEPELLAFMRRTAVLERMCGPLCDAVTGSTKSAAVLDKAERSSLFLEPLDRRGEWYRFHGLLRDVLRSELEQREPELVPELHARAAEWLEAQGDLESALEHVYDLGDAGWAARILARIGLPVYVEGRAAVVEAWLERFAALAPLHAHPAVAALGAWIHALRGRADEADRWLEAAERGHARGTLAEAPVSAVVALLRAALCEHGPDRMQADIDAALAKLPARSPWLPAALLLRGAAWALRGESAPAETSFAGAVEAAERADELDVRVAADAWRSALVAASGDHAAAESLALEARELLADGPAEDHATGAIVHAVAARAFLRHGSWSDGRRELAAAEQAAERLTHALPWLAGETRLALAAAYVTLRDRDGASAELDEVDRLLARRPSLGVVAARAADLRRQVDELPEGRDGRASGLTAAELRLLPLLATHLSFREIGDRLFVSRNTIKTQAISAYRKLGVASRSAAVERASALGLVDDAAGAPVEFTRTG